MNRRLLAGVVLLLACGGGAPRREEAEPYAALVAKSARDTGDAVIELDSETVARIGLRTASVRRSVHPAEQELTGVVVEEPGAATAVRSGVSGRLSEVPGHSWPRIGEQIGAGQLVAQVGDARPLSAPRGGTVTRVLTQPGELVQSGQILLEVVDYRSALVRFGWPPDGSPAPRSIQTAPLGSTRRAEGRLVGPSPEADPVSRRPAVLYRVEGGSANLRPGVAMIAYIPVPGPSVAGVEVPADAVVQWASLAWAYVERAPGRYARVRVPTEHPVPDGWRVTSGFRPGDRVVVVGAGQLLSEEFRARIVVGEEVGE